MPLLMIYSEDGSSQPGSTFDLNMMSRFDGRQAVETWQVGYVKGELAIRLKTVSSVNRLLRQANDGDLLKVTYQARLTHRQLQETLVVRFVGHEPVLMPWEQPALSDSEVVGLLEVGWGEYITVTYRLMSRHETKEQFVIPPHWLREHARAESAIAA